MQSGRHWMLEQSLLPTRAFSAKGLKPGPILDKPGGHQESIKENLLKGN